MKTYTKPTLEVINMRTSENIANNLIKTLYEKTQSGGQYQQMEGLQNYDSSVDLYGSNPASLTMME